MNHDYKVSKMKITFVPQSDNEKGISGINRRSKINE